MGEQVVTFGEIMMRLSAPRYQRLAQSSAFNIHYGGGEANVAVSLANYGVPVSFVTRLPENDLGYAVVQQLRAFNVDTKHILKGGKRLGLYFLEHGAVNRGSKVIYDREGSAFAEIQPGMVDWEQVFRNASWFHWSGITPAVSQGAADACLEAVQQAREHGLTISCDLNFRRNLWQYGKKPSEVMPSLVKYCDVLLADKVAAESMLGVSTQSGNRSPEYETFCKALAEHYPSLRNIAVTMRDSVNASHNRFKAVLWNGSRLIESLQHDITHIVDRVGGGDAFMGALIYGLNHYNDDQQALDFAAAAASLKHTVEGDFNRVTAEEVENFMGGDGLGRVVR